MVPLVSASGAQVVPPSADTSTEYLSRLLPPVSGTVHDRSICVSPFAVAVRTGAPGTVGVFSVSFTTTGSSTDQLRPELLQILARALLVVASSKWNVVPATSSVRVSAAVRRAGSNVISSNPFGRRKSAVIV